MAKALGVFSRFPLTFNSCKVPFVLIHSARLAPPAGPNPFISKLQRFKNVFSYDFSHERWTTEEEPLP